MSSSRKRRVTAGIAITVSTILGTSALSTAVASEAPQSKDSSTASIAVADAPEPRAGACEEYKKILKNLDAEKYKDMWESGRAGQWIGAAIGSTINGCTDNIFAVLYKAYVDQMRDWFEPKRAAIKADGNLLKSYVGGSGSHQEVRAEVLRQQGSGFLEPLQYENQWNRPYLELVKEAVIQAKKQMITDAAKKVLQDMGDENYDEHVGVLDFRALSSYAFDPYGDAHMDRLHEALTALLNGNLKQIQLTRATTSGGGENEVDLYGHVKINGQALWERPSDMTMGAPKNSDMLLDQQIVYTTGNNATVDINVLDHDPTIIDRDDVVLYVQRSLGIAPGNDYHLPASGSTSGTARMSVSTVKVPKHGQEVYLSVKHSGKFADGQGRPEASLVQWEHNSANHQKWRLWDPDGDGYFLIQSASTERCMTAGSQTSQVVVQSGCFKNNAGNLWKFSPAGDGYYQLINKASGKAIDVSGGSQANGSDLITHSPSAGGKNQRWRVGLIRDGLTMPNLPDDEPVEIEPTA
ncbi:RICIN domain-containing protein [Streptomyces pathocidini]|uniref:RICIN domain-containing protein n=1 Tax=Streptomyces pathocidini TaxID=1650571 RepID=A0ABW7UUU9_9ACTN|nr:RICIN domain-containing protein [Streptomyces pathocidini]